MEAITEDGIAGMMVEMDNAQYGQFFLSQEIMNIILI